MWLTFRVEEVWPVARDARASSRFEGTGGRLSVADP